MKVLVTGGCGFLGSHICEYYKNKGWEVTSLDNMTKHELMRTGYSVHGARTFNWDFLKSLGVEMVKGDIRNIDDVVSASKDCDFIAHTAAQPAMTISVEDPRLDFEVNVKGTFNILEAARKFDLPIVSCATGHVYGPRRINASITEKETRYVREPMGVNEEEPILQGELTPLHASKRAAEIYLQTYIDSYNLKAASFRLTGIYGPRQFGGEDHGWVANFAIRLLTGRPMKIFGNGKQTRDIVYAQDVADAFHAFYEKKVPGIYNIGGGEKTMISLVECIKILEEMNNLKADVEFGPDRFGDLRYFVCDIAKAQKNLGWNPKTLPKEGIGKLCEWIKQNNNIFKEEQ
jgi:CDP-paratose 2-epimerase